MHPQPQIPLILQVSQLTMQIKSLLESDFSYVEVQGEVSGFTHHNSGHIYFNLKDEHATIACTFFRHNSRNNPIKLQNGDKIIAKGSISVFSPRGTYNLNIIKCVHSGIGDLKVQYEALKKDLEARNYFCKNKPLPKFPKRIILLTSKTSAALQDMIKVASKRFCLCEFILIDTLTQGREAKYSIAKNLAYADRLGADILVLARGGGSIEDLWSFNEMEVLEAIFACKTPVVSAIGHEIDYLLSDYVADVRAPTPSAAMEMILQDKDNLITQLCDMESLLTHKMQTHITHKKSILNHLTQNLEILNPLQKIEQYQAVLQTLTRSLKDSIKWFYTQKKYILSQQQERLELAKPTQKLLIMKTDIKTLRAALNAQFMYFIEQKANKQKQLYSDLENTMFHVITRKKAMLTFNLNMSIQHALQQKRLMINNLMDMLHTLDPSKKTQHGFAQILKDNKLIQVCELQNDDIIEIVDPSGIRKARILS
ncbi:exodeoxyribonuclease VII large subunit [Helicobacter trogontum]|uniref:exodeoxyribonuclease VII large subunit n=1 Tax=Helicobacter trogontum TaxID=50960 RepID=UPI000CF11B67|nr:exodeoxyribonuclease VII large subunit [Helicobacter trogontum]